MNAPARSEGPPIYAGRSYDAVAHRALDVRAFVAIDLALREAGIRAPEILAADIGCRAAAPRRSRQRRNRRRRRRADHRALRSGDRSPRLHARPRTGRPKRRCRTATRYRLPPYDRDALLDRDIAVSGLVRRPWRRAGLPAGAARRISRRPGRSVLDAVDEPNTTWVLRDFHSPNILWQEQRERHSPASASSISRTR